MMNLDETIVVVGCQRGRRNRGHSSLLGHINRNKYRDIGIETFTLGLACNIHSLQIEMR